MFIENRRPSHLFDTHPPIADRIKVLRELGGLPSPGGEYYSEGWVARRFYFLPLHHKPRHVFKVFGATRRKPLEWLLADCLFRQQLGLLARDQGEDGDERCLPALASRPTDLPVSASVPSASSKSSMIWNARPNHARRRVNAPVCCVEALPRIRPLRPKRRSTRQSFMRCSRVMAPMSSSVDSA